MNYVADDDLIEDDEEEYDYSDLRNRFNEFIANRTQELITYLLNSDKEIRLGGILLPAWSKKEDDLVDDADEDGINTLGKIITNTLEPETEKDLQNLHVFFEEYCERDSIVFFDYTVNINKYVLPHMRSFLKEYEITPYLINVVSLVVLNDLINQLKDENNMPFEWRVQLALKSIEIRDAKTHKETIVDK